MITVSFITTSQGHIDKLTQQQAALQSSLTVAENNQEIYEKEYTAMEEEITQRTVAITSWDILETQLATEKNNYATAMRALESAIISGESSAKISYLTFDDGPYELTHEFLKVLEKENVPATFFVLGKPDRIHIYNEVLDHGHVLANHTYSHKIKNGIYTSPQHFVNDVVKLDTFLMENLGVPSCGVVRFPGGSPTAREHKNTIVSNLGDLGYGYINWGSSTGDGVHNDLTTNMALEIMEKSLKDRPIDVMLMHDYNHASLDALPVIIQTLREKGYHFFPLFKESHMVYGVKDI